MMSQCKAQAEDASGLWRCLVEEGHIGEHRFDAQYYRAEVARLQTALEGAEAQARLRGKVLEDCATALHADRMHDGKWRDCLRWGCQGARAAIDITPDEAKEKQDAG
jgi:hypothetical protein